MISTEWISVIRPDDREVVGYLEMVDDGFVPYDLLGRQVYGETPLPYQEAEELLIERGLSYLASRWKLEVEDADEPIDVVIKEISPERVILISDDYQYGKAIGTPFSLELPENSGRLQPGAPGATARFINAVPGYGKG
ncbi:hypothetical protein FHU41_000359 [Psychromicrobium silvestre]|uniref:Uncharacterized protein n=1 Tax=Psychromicrobium silvestre TaxID=1645614 RepID=A0A7Y9LRA7_9MICC|nr:hypothetical protein [Psychromicrobium silvestre]NYE94138.1 hypothetical protein [Psychromicrobium silvestre]